MASGYDETHVEDLRRRLDEAEETLRAIRSGEVDALIVEGADGEQVYTLQGADHPYRALIESMQQGALSLGGDGTILYCNRRFAEMVARPQEKVIGAAMLGSSTLRNDPSSSTSCAGGSDLAVRGRSGSSRLTAR